MKLTTSLLSKRLVLMTACLGSLAFSSYATTDKEPVDSLTIESQHFDRIWVADQGSFPNEKKLYLADVKASFSVHWLKEFESSTSDRYRENTLRNYSELLHKALSEKLIDEGWELLGQPSEEAFSIKINLRDIHIMAPEQRQASTTLVAFIGNSQLDVALIGTNGEVIMEINDSRSTGGLESAFIEANNAINYIWFKKLMNGWASDVTPYITLVADIASEK